MISYGNELYDEAVKQFLYQIQEWDTSDNRMYLVLHIYDLDVELEFTKSIEEDCTYVEAKGSNYSKQYHSTFKISEPNVPNDYNIIEKMEDNNNEED